MSEWASNKVFSFGKNFLFLSLFLSFTLLFLCCDLFKRSNPKKESEKSVKTIYLLRHAKSDHDSLGLADFDRQLEKRGIDNAIAMGEFFKAKSPCLDLAIVSPAVRTKQTFNLVCAKWMDSSVKVVWDTALYNCSTMDAFDVVKVVPEDKKCVLMVGPNTWITSFANMIQSEKSIDEISTGGMVAVKFENIKWSEISTKKGKLLFFQKPRDL